MIDEIRGYAVTGDKPGDAIFGAHDESGGGIAVDQLVLRRGQSPPLFRRDREDRPTARAGGVERLDQHARSGALAAADVDRGNLVTKVQRLLDDPPVQPVEEREACRCEQERAHGIAVETPETGRASSRESGMQ